MRYIRYIDSRIMRIHNADIYIHNKVIDIVYVCYPFVHCTDTVVY